MIGRGWVLRQSIMGWAALALAVAMSPGWAEAPTGLSGSVPEGVMRATLPNGLQVVVVPDRLAPVVTTELNYLAGSNDSPAGYPGTAHALEHMMFRGSAGLDRDQLAELGTLLGGVYNADTTETVTQYTYTVPADDLGLVLHIEALRMQGLSLNEADWEQERGAIQQEVSRDLSSPLYTYLSEAQAILFAGTPYAHDALGTKASFDRTDAARLRRFYERWYAPNNAILVIAGAVEPARALAEAKAAFGAIPRRPVPAHASVSAAPVQAKTLALTTDFPVGLITLAYRMPGLRAADFAAADILGDVLGSERGDLYGLVPAGQALIARFEYQAKADVGVGVAVAAFPEGGDPSALLAEMRRIIATTAQGGVSPELVAAAKRQELAQLAFQSDSISGLARSWSRALAFQGAASPEDLARAYAAVTVEDVNRLAKLLLDPAQAVTAILTPRRSGEAVAGQGFGGAESFASAPGHPVVLPDWAAAALASLQLPAPAPPPNVSVLPNGLTLIVQPEHVSHTVSVYGRVRNVPVMEELPGQEGIASMAGEMFGYGTVTQDRLAFQKALDDIAAVESGGFGFSLRVLTPQFEPGMRLLAANELQPAFPPDAFAVVRRQLAQSLAGMLQSPGYRFGRAVNRAVVPAGDPTLRQATPATVTTLSPADLQAYYKAAFRPDLTTIVVLGDVTPAEARRVVGETFGGWQAPGAAPAIDLPPIGANAPSEAYVPDASRLQDQVLLTESVALPVTSPDRYAVTLGNVILGSGFSSRLYQDLRVKTGYVYSVSSGLQWGRTRTRYAVSFGADPGDLGKARALVLRDIREMQATLVGDVELARAKAEVLRQLPMQRASVGAIAALYLRLEDLGLPLDEPQTSAERTLAVTGPEIQQAFARWLRPDGLAEVVEGPAPGQ